MTQPPPPEDIVLSILTWHGSPSTCSVDGYGLEGYVGEYREAYRSTWRLVGRNDANTAYLYKPPNTRNETFSYFKQAFIGTAGSDITELGAILAAEMPPVARIGLPTTNLWPELATRMDSDDEEAMELSSPPCLLASNGLHCTQEGIPGPPFKFYERDFPQSDHTFFSARETLCLGYPDLPGQPEGDAGTANMIPGRERDSWDGVGWHGPWVDELISRAKEHKALGEITRTVSSSEQGWTMDLRLVATSIRLQDWKDLDLDLEEEDEDSETQSIFRYDVRATINALCIEPAGVMAQQQVL